MSFIKNMNDQTWIFIIKSFPSFNHKKNILPGTKNAKLFNHSVMSNSLWPHELQHTRLTCPSPSPGACSNSCPLCQWCHPTISPSVVSFSFCLQSFPASGSFPMSQFFASDGQSTGVSASAAVLPMNIQNWFPLGLTGLISLYFHMSQMVEHYDSCFKPLQDKKAKQKIINVHSKFSRSSRRTKIWQNQKTVSMIILFYLGHPHLIHPFKTNFTEIYYELHILLSFPGKESICQCRRCKIDPWVRMILWERNGNPLQYSCLGNPMH